MDYLLPETVSSLPLAPLPVECYSAPESYILFSQRRAAMPNPKTSPDPPKPVAQHGWVHKCDLDDYLGRHLPIPTQAVSNEEYYPLPQTEKQKAVEQRLLEMAARDAKRLGMDRRAFLRTSCGMATAFAAMNTVFGPYFRVDAAEMLEPAGGEESKV